MLRTTLATAAIAVLSLLGETAPAARAEEERPEIRQVRLATFRGHIVGDVDCSGLLSERVVGTVQSGLPAVVDLLYYVSARNGGVLVEDVRSYSLQHDVWQDTYAIESQDTTLAFPAFAEMRQAIEHLRHVRLAPLAALRPGQTYQVHMSVVVNPLQGMDRGKMTEWVRENMRTSDDQSSREQVLNLNDLITHFFSRDRGAVNRSAWYSTAYFKPDSLQAQDPEVK